MLFKEQDVKGLKEYQLEEDYTMKGNLHLLLGSREVQLDSVLLCKLKKGNYQLMPNLAKNVINYLQVP